MVIFGGMYVNAVYVGMGFFLLCMVAFYQANRFGSGRLRAALGST